ncbi:MAG: hypothetical protein U1E27_12900, partial [Kiritimatiellia bacterium]|nr:hypothetical protein [Kiritimatiellia bacterium]
GNSLFWTTLDRTSQDLNDMLQCGKRNVPEKLTLTGGEQEDFFSEVSEVHPIQRLPIEFVGLPNGHHGSHQFLVDDFVRSVVQSKLAPNHVWAAARYTTPGIIAHESAKRDGELLKIPDFGNPPTTSKYISYDS